MMSYIYDVVICKFCGKNYDDGHFCAKYFTYKYIFERMLLSIFLEYEPSNTAEFWEITSNLIESQNLFESSHDPYDIAYKNLTIFVDLYDCF